MPRSAITSHADTLQCGGTALSLAPAVCADLLEAMPVAVLWLDRHGTVRQCNTRALALLGAALLGAQWRTLVGQRFCTGATDAELTLADGVPVIVTISPYGGGQLLALTAHATAAAASDAEARHARLAEIGKLAAGLAHQLRTPIAAAQVYLDLARDTGNVAYLAQTQVALDSLTRHTEGLLTLARGEIQRDAHISTVELVDFTVRQAQPLLGANALDVTNTWPEARMRCNQHLLAGVILNLIENAVQASSPGARIGLHCRRSADLHAAAAIEIAVVDTGRGMASALCARLGEPLFTARPHGTGLGLTMARLIVERHGGALQIDSLPGHGTAVVMHLVAG